MSRSKNNHQEWAVEEVLAVVGFKARERYLKSRPELFCPKLVDAFLASAHKTMRADPREAAQRARLARTIAIQLLDEPARIECLRALAQAYTLQGRYQAALRTSEAALTAAVGEVNDAVVAELEIIQLPVLAHLERYAEAQAKGLSSLDTFRRLGDCKRQVRCHVMLADLAFRMDQPQEALRHHRAVRAIMPKDASPKLHAVTAANCAIALEARNRFRAAARYFEKAACLLADQGCDHTLAQVQYNAAYLEILRGNYEDALRRYAQVRPVFERLQDERHLAHVDLDCAEIHVHLNMPEEAAKLSTSAGKLFLKLGLAKESAQAAQLAGRAAGMSGDADAAEAHLSRAQERFHKLDLAEREFTCMTQRASMAEQQGNVSRMRMLAESAAALMGDRTNPVSRASVELLRARIDIADDYWDQALRRAESARELCQRIHVPWLHIEANRVIGRIHAGLGDLGEAMRAFRSAIECLEHYRGGVPPDEYMAAFLAGRSDLYEETVDLLVRAGETDEAFEFTERAKSRALVDLLAGRTEAAPRADLPRLTEKKLHHLRQQLNALYHRIFRGSDDARGARAVRNARAAAAHLEGEVGNILRRSRVRDAEWASLQTVAAPSIDSVRDDLEPGTVLVEYFVTRNRLFTFVVRNEDVHVVRQEVKSSELARLLERFTFHLAKFRREEVAAEELVYKATRANLAKLAAILTDPISDLLGDRAVFVPHGLLHRVPFHALPCGDGWLIDQVELAYAPSAAVYKYCRRKAQPASGPASVFGLPDGVAPQIEDEVRKVADVLASDRLYIGDTATLERVRSEAPDARILHIATHGMFRREQPMLSAIRLADTWLNLYDIYALKVGGELVVLSTCESGIADVTDGDEILGLTRGFLYAGARAILASQWPVNDATTTQFMEHFYRELEQCGDAYAAHRVAMRKIRESHPHPYYWAPFFLTGRPVQALAKREHTQHETRREPCLVG